MVTVWVETVGLCARCSGLTGRLAPGHARSSNLCSTLVCGRQPVCNFGACECNVVHSPRTRTRRHRTPLSRAKVQCRDDRRGAKGVAVGGGGGHGRRLVRLGEVRLE